jgi:pSer/pThr/pTyr-binding forkhead associated (FHA) protein
LVNLVSTNGIYVNGKKRLTAYLADGDQIKLCMATLIFKSGSGAPASSPSRASGQGAEGTSGKLASRLPLLGFAAVVIAIGLWWLLR